MAEIFKVEIITPDRIFYEGEAEFMEFTTIAGDIGVYAKHIPMTTVLAPGAVAVHNGGEVVIAAVHSGFAEILGDKVTLLAEVAEWPDEIDVSRAEAAKDRAEQLISVVDELAAANQVIVDTTQTVSAIMEEVSAHSNETLDASEKNLQVVLQVSEQVDRLKEQTEKLQAAEK